MTPRSSGRPRLVAGAGLANLANIPGMSTGGWNMLYYSNAVCCSKFCRCCTACGIGGVEFFESASGACGCENFVERETPITSERESPSDALG